MANVRSLSMADGTGGSFYRTSDDLQDNLNQPQPLLLDPLAYQIFWLRLNERMLLADLLVSARESEDKVEVMLRLGVKL